VIVLVSLLALPLIFLLVPGRSERTRRTEAQALEGPERRLALARIGRDAFWRRCFAVAGILVIVSLTVSFAFTRLPRAIDPPRILNAEQGDAGEIRIPKAGLEDGHLHRFGVSIDGTVVRFFVMKSGSRLLPAFDACQVCGAYGYIETKGRLVCLTCAADINVATLTVGGGCNPLPLPFRDTGSALVVSLEDLRSKAPFFRGVGGGGAAEPAPTPPTRN
jgi:uncharacterized membrane protein